MNVIKNPDLELEQFWETYKCSLTNFYNEFKSYKRPLNRWYDTLNHFQKYQKYSHIQKFIFNYLTLHMIDVIKSKSKYHLSILKNNIKRYKKVCNNIHFYKFTNEINRLEIILKIYNSIDAQHDFIFLQIELCLMYNDVISLIQYGIKYKKDSILDNVIRLNSTETFEYIEYVYNLKLPKNIKGKKIIKLTLK